MAETHHDPLLEDWPLPPFDRITLDTVPAALDAALAENERTLEAVARAAGDDAADWDSIVTPLESASDLLARVWSPIRHLHAVADSPQLRAVYDDGLPKLTAYYSKFGQHAGLYGAYQSLRDSAAFEAFDPARRMAIEQALRDFRLAGIDLAPEAQARYREISQRLSELSNRFSQNLLDATDAWSLSVPEARLEGLPDAVREQALTAARDAGSEGGLLSLDGPTYLAVLTHADDRDLRRELYVAWTTRASRADDKAGATGEASTVAAGADHDNAPLIDEIMALRFEQTQLLGFDSFADRQLSKRMAASPQEVLTFLGELAERARPQARRELDELTEYARTELGLDELQAWDLGWVGERLRKARYDVSQETLRPYFPVDRVVSGMFEIVRRLFDVSVTERSDWATWHESVRCFEIARDGEVLGRFYLDLYARRHKRGGAWMDGCLGRRQTADGIQVPVTFLTCNFGGPVGERPALLTHDEVTTLFHEFGHGLHHMLTRVDVADVAGINGVPWDAVELPSQFLENWCWHPDAIELISAHWQTGEPLPRELLDRLLAARNFQSAMMVVRQLELGMFDFRLHHEYRPDEPGIVRRILSEVRDAVAVVRPPEFNRFENAFAHVFSGGYAAGYYSYLWAEVLSSDAFSRFEEEGVFNAQVGQAFLENILERGGSEAPAELFRRFRGRDPEIGALLRHRGIEGAKS
ncbi:MAG TPA: M3 family metallopeptidase [Pseudomonadales bacterium]|nr:M3 family metallopeptidase [Pseudomonadales bacterium]